MAWDSTYPERKDLSGSPGLAGSCSAASTHEKATLKICLEKDGVVTLLTWNHACLVGVRAMDDQHGIMMDALNDLRLALVQGRGRDEISEGLNRLIEFTRMHFISEEQLLEQNGYSGLVQHRAAHQHLLSQIEEMALRTQHNDELHMRSLLVFLRDWYMSHIEDQDSQYGAWLNTRGIN